jgi:hypothetical protein
MRVTIILEINQDNNYAERLEIRSVVQRGLTRLLERHDPQAWDTIKLMDKNGNSVGRLTVEEEHAPDA